MDYLEEDLREVRDRIAKQEEHFNKRMEDNHKELKMLIRETEIHNKEKTNKLFDGIDRVLDSIHKLTLSMNSITHETKQNTETIKELKDNDKWKSRAIYGGVISLILMILGTFAGMFFDFPQ